MNKKDVIISSSKMDLNNHLKETIYEKVERLFRHEAQIIRIQVELEKDVRKNDATEYLAKGHIEIKGNPMIVTASTTDIYKSIDEMVDKLDRKIRRRSRLDRVKRKSVHEIDIPSTLPKVVEA